jgi:hypothetical protein
MKGKVTIDDDNMYTIYIYICVCVEMYDINIYMENRIKTHKIPRARAHFMGKLQ